MTNQQPVACPKKILVVDDNEVIRKAVSLKLKASGYEAFTAADGSAVVKVVDKEKLDLILLDILFPPDATEGGMSWDGLVIMRWLRNMSGAKDVPIIIISGTEPAKYEPCLAAGARAFLHKPLDMDELIAVVRAVLGENYPQTA
jgi:two-component system KDP operon response regulator KdpE